MNATVVAIFLSSNNYGVVDATSPADRHVFPMPSATLFPGVNVEAVVDPTQMSRREGRYSFGGGVERILGIAHVRSSFLRQMQLSSGIDLALSNVDTSDDDALHKIKMTHIISLLPRTLIPSRVS